MRSLALLCLVLGSVGSACTSDDARPSEDVWVPMWEQRKAAIPDVDAVMSGGRQLCDELDTEFRVTLPELLPAPSDALDAPVQEWSSHAIRIVFECTTDEASLIEQFDVLDVLAAEIDGGIGFQN